MEKYTTRPDLLKMIQRYHSGKATTEERLFIDEYYASFEKRNEASPHLTKEEEQAMEKQMLEQLFLHINKTESYNTEKGILAALWPRIAAAAAILIFLSAGGYFLLRKKQQPIQQVAKNRTMDIAPGGNKVIITLGNGSKIELNGAKVGKLAQQGNTVIKKTANGQISYASSNSNIVSKNIVYNTATTPRGGQYQLILADGTKVWLNAASSIKYPVEFNGDERKVELTGEAYFEVAHNAKMPFIVHANNTDIRVLGTHFNVNAYGDDHSLTTTLLEGSVRIQSSGFTALLKPGQQGVVLDNSNSITVKDADIDEVMAWKNGLFLFNDEHLDAVMKEISRWYNVDVEFRDQDVKREEYSGMVSRFSQVSQVLKTLQILGGVEFQIEPNKIIVMKK